MRDLKERERERERERRFFFSTFFVRSIVDAHPKKKKKKKLALNHDSFRGRPRGDDDFLVDAGVGPGAKVTAAETAEWRRSRGADAALARAQEEEARREQQQRPASHPLSTPSPEVAISTKNAPSSSSNDPVARQLDALEAAIANLETEAEAAGLFSPASSDERPPPRQARGGLLLFSRQRQQEEPAAPPSSNSGSSNPAALYKEALRLSEFSTQQLLKLDAVELPHVGEEGAEGERDRERGNIGNGNSTAAALAKERALALRSRRKALIRRAQALGDAMDRAKERLK